MCLFSLAENEQFFVSTGQTVCAQTSVTHYLPELFTTWRSLLEGDPFNSHKYYFR